MSKKFAVFDIDGTLIRWQLYHAIADEFARLGLIDPKTYVSIKDARMQWKRREYLEAFKDYEMHLVRAYDKLLKDLTPEQLEAAAATVFEEYKDQTYTYTRELIKGLKQRGYLLFAISGSHEEVITKIAAYYGFDDFIGAQFTRKDGQFTGEKFTPIFDKQAALDSLLKKHETTFAGSIAVGDSASDIAMLEAVEQPIAFNPEQHLYDHAKAKDWKIVLERKNVVYELRSDGGTYLLA